MARTRGLTKRKIGDLALITQGHSNAEVAALTHLSPNTVKSYIRTIYRKIDVTSRTQAVLWGVPPASHPTITASNTGAEDPDRGGAVGDLAPDCFECPAATLAPSRQLTPQPEWLPLAGDSAEEVGAPAATSQIRRADRLCRSAVVAFFAGAAVGLLGGMIGLGGAEIRLPLLIGLFGFLALQAVIVNRR